jgi:hypothetical protein
MLEYSRDLVLHPLALVHSPSRCAWQAELHDTAMPPVFTFLVLALLAVFVYQTLRIPMIIVIAVVRIAPNFSPTLVVRVIIRR